MAITDQDLVAALSRELVFAGRNSRSWRLVSGSSSRAPRPEGFLSEDAERAAGCEMALDVESVLDGRMNGQEALSGSGRFETLHLALAPPCLLGECQESCARGHNRTDGG